MCLIYTLLLDSLCVLFKALCQYITSPRITISVDHFHYAMVTMEKFWLNI